MFVAETQHPGSSDRVDPVVVGAGLAGLAAARDLLAAGLSVLVLEARDRVGGRLLNHTLRNGAVVELGGQWVGLTQDRVLALAGELGVGVFPTYIEGDHLLAVDGEVRRYGGDDFALPEDALADVGGTQQRLARMAAEVPLDEPWRAPQAAAWDAQTLETWLVVNSETDVEPPAQRAPGARARVDAVRGAGFRLAERRGLGHWAGRSPVDEVGRPDRERSSGSTRGGGRQGEGASRSA